MKKLTASVMAMVMVMSLTACQNKTANEAESVTETKSTKSTETQKEVWPEKDITLIVPWKAGGGGDVSARLVAKHWGEELGVNVIVDNREGGSGMVGTSYFYGMKQDGSYMMFNSEPFYGANIINNNASFTEDDLAILATYVVDPCCISLIPDDRFSTFDEFNDYIQKNPGAVKIGLNGGSSGVILVKMLMDYYQWDVKLVYYSTASEMRTALVGEHLDAIATTTSACVEDKAIIMAAEESMEAIQDVPTYEEKTGEELVLGTTRYFAASAEFKEAYPERYQILTETLKSALTREEYLVAANEAGMGAVTVYYGPEESMEMSKSMFALVEQYQELLKAE